MNIVITGKLSKTRDELTKEFAQYGIYVLPSMRANIDYLVTDTPDSGSSKNTKAQQFGIERISENDFRQIILTKTSKFVRKMIPDKNPIKGTAIFSKKSKPPTKTTLTRYLDF